MVRPFSGLLAPGVAAGVLDPQHAAEIAQRRASRLLRTHPEGEVPLDLLVEKGFGPAASVTARVGGPRSARPTADLVAIAGRVIQPLFVFTQGDDGLASFRMPRGGGAAPGADI